MSAEPSPKTASLDDVPTLTHMPGAALATPVLREPLTTKQTFGDYELLYEIARGGMGIVYKARQKRLNRIVALKMILAGRLAGPEEIKRFQIEATAAAQLQHANIVAIYEVGEVEGQQFFSMEFVSGMSLHQRLLREAMPAKLAAHYIEQIARALHYAHQRGVLHRDLKPANILLDDQDRPKLTDFGLAKVVASSDAARDGSPHPPTRTGTVMGTPSYMAPEQAGGLTKDIGPACDIYGLGAVLYELVTGRPPFKAESSLETVMQVLHQDPLPPRLLNRNIDSDLETICLKCLEKDPTMRYASAEALAEDLKRYLQHEPISARSVNILERLGRTLAHSQHDKEFRHWGQALIALGCIIFASHLCTSLMLHSGVQEEFCYWGPRSLMVALFAAGLWRFRPHSLLMPTNSAERVVWAVWCGYLIAFGAMYGVMWLQGGTHEHVHLHIYGPSTVLSGMAYFVMGAHVWGGCYLIGLAFMLLALVFADFHGSTWSPFWFGLLWFAALAVLGIRYLWLARSAEAEETLAG